MFLNFDIKTLDKMSDGVVLIDRYGQVTDFNDAAKPWVKHCMNGAEMLSVLLASVQRKNSRLPLQVDLFGSSDAETVPEAGPVLPEVHLCNDGQDGYALLFTLTRWPTPVVGLVSQGPAQSHLIGDDVRHELSDLIREIATVRANTGVPRLNELRQHAQHLRALTRHGVGQDATAATNIHHLEALQRHQSVNPVQPQGVDLVQWAELALLVPPAVR